MDAPRISVLLPVYNAEAFLREALESVLVQDYGDFELIALDDGSTDKSLSILQEFKCCDPRVMLITRENRGLVPSLNELLHRARGEFVARMDADDVCMPHRFRKQVWFLENNLDCVAVGGWVIYMNGLGNPIGLIRTPISHQEIDAANLKGHTSICHPAAMIRKSVLVGLGGYRPEFIHCEDLDLWLRLAEQGNVANLGEPVLFYRLHDQSISQTMVELQRNSAYSACSSAWERRKIAGTFEATELWRPSNRDSFHRFNLQYGWTAWANGYRGTWWYYARKAIKDNPFSLASWKLFIIGALRTRATEGVIDGPPSGRGKN